MCGTSNAVRKGQTSIDFLFVVGILIAFIAAVMVVGVRESELTVAISASRLAMVQFSQQNSSFFFTQVTYTLTGTNCTITPLVFSPDGSRANTTYEMKVRILNSIKNSLEPNAQDVQVPENGLPAQNYVYYVQ